MKIKTPREKRILIIKNIARWTLYYIFILFCFVIMTAGTSLKPILLVPAALCIAMKNGQTGAALTGAACGFLIDISCGRLFGYNAVILTIFSVLVSLLFNLYFREKFISILMITAAASFIQGWLDYKFYYEIWNYENVDRIFSSVTIPVWGYTVASTAVVYIVIKLINHFLMPKKHLTLQEAIKAAPKNN